MNEELLTDLISGTLTDCDHESPTLRNKRIRRGMVSQPRDTSDGDDL